MSDKQRAINDLTEEITNWCVIREYNLTERDIAQLTLDLYDAGYCKITDKTKKKIKALKTALTWYMDTYGCDLTDHYNIDKKTEESIAIAKKMLEHQE